MINKDQFSSLFFHLAKCFVALLLNYYFVNSFSASDYANWSVMMSILIILSVSDLGVGQYVMTRLINHGNGAQNEHLMKDAFSLLWCTSFLSLFFLLFILPRDVFYYVATFFIVVIRLVFIPFGAILSSINQYKLRKIIDFLFFTFGAVLVVVCGAREPDLMRSFVIFNMTISMGSIAVFYFSRKYHSLSIKDIFVFRISNVKTIAYESFPYFLNNIAGLVVYGGFIWMVSIVLAIEDVAKLAILHSFFFMNLYQMIDVFARARQSDFICIEKFNFFDRSASFLIFFICLLFAVFGKFGLYLISPNYRFSNIEILAYSVFVIVELKWLIIQSRMQIFESMAKLLAVCSIAKFVLLFSVVMAFKFILYCNSPVILILTFSCGSLLLLMMTGRYGITKK